MRLLLLTEDRDEAIPLIITKGVSGSQTLSRGLDVLQAVALGVTNLVALTETLKLHPSAVRRLASALVELRYLSLVPHAGYSLGPKLLEMIYLAQRQMSIPRVAREALELLAARTGDTVHLGIVEGHRALCLDKLPGRHRVEISSRIGERQPLRSTGLVKALILDEDEVRWRELYEYEMSGGHRYNVPLNVWLTRMQDYARQGYTLDLEENEDSIRCVAAPVRDATGKIVAAISVSSAAQYLDDHRIEDLAGQVREAAAVISCDLGFKKNNGHSPSRS